MRSFAILATIYAATVGTASALVDARLRTNVEVEASGFDPDGCNPDGCVAENTRDNNRGASSRWSCRGTLVDGDAGCRITYDFDDPQDIHSLRIAFYEGTEGTLTLNVRVNGNLFDTITSSGTTDVYQTFVLGTEDTTSISLNHDDFANRPHEWVSLTEVRIMVD